MVLVLVRRMLESRTPERHQDHGMTMIERTGNVESLSVLIEIMYSYLLLWWWDWGVGGY